MSEFEVVVLGEARRGYGKLSISGDVIVLDAEDQLLRHEARRIVVIRPRLDISERRVTFVLQGGGRAAAVRAHSCPTARLADALVSHGFELDTRRTFADAVPAPSFFR